MNQPDHKNRRTMIEKAAGSFMLLSFGLASLAYLIAIDRADWFAVRPASGVAQAMANASDKYAERRDQATGKDGERAFRLTRAKPAGEEMAAAKAFGAN
ncbi:hypothetical protein [Sphingobium sp. Z007]|nr:hypothetical protein [Sphingobium sp. Z007]